MRCYNCNKINDYTQVRCTQCGSELQTKLEAIDRDTNSNNNNNNTDTNNSNENNLSENSKDKELSENKKTSVKNNKKSSKKDKKKNSNKNTSIKKDKDTDTDTDTDKGKNKVVGLGTTNSNTNTSINNEDKEKKSKKKNFFPLFIILGILIVAIGSTFSSKDNTFIIKEIPISDTLNSSVSENKVTDGVNAIISALEKSDTEAAHAINKAEEEAISAQVKTDLDLSFMGQDFENLNELATTIPESLQEYFIEATNSLAISIFKESDFLALPHYNGQYNIIDLLTAEKIKDIAMAANYFKFTTADFYDKDTVAYKIYNNIGTFYDALLDETDFENLLIDSNIATPYNIRNVDNLHSQDYNEETDEILYYNKILVEDLDKIIVISHYNDLSLDYDTSYSYIQNSNEDYTINSESFSVYKIPELYEIESTITNSEELKNATYDFCEVAQNIKDMELMLLNYSDLEKEDEEELVFDAVTIEKYLSTSNEDTILEDVENIIINYGLNFAKALNEAEPTYINPYILENSLFASKQHDYIMTYAKTKWFIEQTYRYVSEIDFSKVNDKIIRAMVVENWESNYFDVVTLEEKIYMYTLIFDENSGSWLISDIATEKSSFPTFQRNINKN